MTFSGWAEIILVLALIVLAAWPVGLYLARITAGERGFLHPVLAPVERGLYALAGVDPARGMSWQGYAAALILLNALHFLMLYAMLRLQFYLPLNPDHLAGMSPRLAFNTAMSFVTNTNWQAYGGETTLSPGSQMWGLTSHMFLSAATGIAAAIAVSRAFAQGGLKTLGNFWADLTRIVLYLLLPIAVIAGIVLVALGVPQTLATHADATTLEGAKQTISLGPVAFMEVIKNLGTNGGGYFNANGAHPFENPNAWSTMLEAWLVFLIPIALTFTFGRIVGDRRQGYALLAVIGVFVLAAIAIAYHAEAAGNPLLTALGVDPAQGNMEGKELRFGIPLSALFNVITTATSCGAVNAMLDSYMPLGGMTSMFLMQLGEIVPGGVGSGLYGLLVFALIAVFVAGLMVGRTPEYLGKKVQAREVKLAMLAVLILPIAILGFTAVSLVLPSALASLGNAGPHGLSEMLYAFTSATGNNGSAFAGLSADTPWLDTTLGIAMLLGRFAFLIPVMAIAGSLAEKVKVPPSSGTFPTHGPLFVGLLAGVIVIMGGLQFMPALSLGPLAEHFVLLAGKTF
jgi:K+-transporting ATPase ATPase A chain